MEAILPILQIIVQNLPGAISTIDQLVDLGSKLYAVQNGREPTPDEIAQLRSALLADVTLALEPLPPAQPGDPDFND